MRRAEIEKNVKKNILTDAATTENQQVISSFFKHFCEFNQQKHDLLNAFYISIEKDNTSIAKLFIESGVDVNLYANITFAPTLGIEPSYPPVIKAINCIATDILALLVSYGADINIVTPDGHTALSEAYYLKDKAREEVLEFLLASGANPYFRLGDDPCFADLYKDSTEANKPISRISISEEFTHNLDKNKLEIFTINDKIGLLMDGRIMISPYYTSVAETKSIDGLDFCVESERVEDSYFFTLLLSETIENEYIRCQETPQKLKENANEVWIYRRINGYFDILEKNGKYLTDDVKRVYRSGLFYLASVRSSKIISNGYSFIYPSKMSHLAFKYRLAKKYGLLLESGLEIVDPFHLDVFEVDANSFTVKNLLENGGVNEFRVFCKLKNGRISVHKRMISKQKYAFDFRKSFTRFLNSINYSNTVYRYISQRVNAILKEQRSNKIQKPKRKDRQKEEHATHVKRKIFHRKRKQQ